MSNSMRRTIIICIIAAAAIGAAFFLRERRSAPPPATQIAAAETYWAARIAAKGAPEAYKEFSAFVAPLNPSDQHGLAHAFGDALYKKAGLPGIAVCDAQFSYGCYHQFIGDAIASEGLGVVDQINAICGTIDNGVPCKHGIGHGLVGYLGYQPTDLKKAIAECAHVGALDSPQGCYGGAFMEYSMRTLAASDARPETSDMYAPCDEYSGAASRSCYLYQPQWWWVEHFSVLTDPVPVSFAKMGAWCAAIKNSADRGSCYEGIGEMVPPNASYRSDDAIKLCDLYSGEGRTRCLDGTAVVFEGTERHTEAAAVCGALSGGDADACVAHMQGRVVL